MTSIANRGDLVCSYRQLYRALLHAVQYSKPARYVARNQLRDAFRKGNALDFDARKVANTLEFLRGAAAETGLEHKLVKNLLLTQWHRKNDLGFRKPFKKSSLVIEIEETAHLHYDMTIAMLNDSMGLCLR